MLFRAVSWYRRAEFLDRDDSTNFIAAQLHAAGRRERGRDRRPSGGSGSQPAAGSQQASLPTPTGSTRTAYTRGILHEGIAILIKLI